MTGGQSSVNERLSGRDLDIVDGLGNFGVLADGCLRGDLDFELVVKAGGSIEPGGLRLSGARGLVGCPPISIFSESSASVSCHPRSTEDAVSLRDAVFDCDVPSTDPDMITASEVDVHSDHISDYIVHELVDISVNDFIDHSKDSDVFREDVVDSFNYYIRSDPVFAEVEFNSTREPVMVTPSCSGVCSVFDPLIPGLVNKPCGDRCFGEHLLHGRRNQLNPCVFFDYLYGGSSIDQNASFVFDGVLNGFRIVDDEFTGSYICPNYASILHKETRSEFESNLETELASQKVTLVKERPACIHALGAIRKHDGGLRPITDCRRPLGLSINNYMDTVCKTFSYVSIDQVTDVVTEGDFMAVLDIKGAYRSVGVFPEHRKFQGFLWNVNGVEQYYEDNRLCFGLKCAPYIYTQITDFIVRSLNRQGVSRVFGYLDDFIVISDSELSCKREMSLLIDLLSQLGFEISWKKVTCPKTTVVYLGIEIDSEVMEVRLPEKKLSRLKHLVESFQDKSECTVLDLQALCGHLAHASKVVRSGRTFSRRIINLTTYASKCGGLCTLPDWFKDDIVWWNSFCRVLNGKCPIISNFRCDELLVETDSSLTGFAAKCGTDWVLGVWCMQVAPEVIPVEHFASSPSE